MNDKQALLEKYPDREWRARLLSITSLVGLMYNCIITDSYKASDELNAAIQLSSAGQKLANHLQRHEIPMRHCVDLSCDRVHSVFLDTSDEAGVNKYRPRAQRLLEKGGKPAWEWGDFIRAIGGYDVSSNDDLNTGSLPYLLGDCLAKTELRTLVAVLLDSDSGLRAKVQELGLSGPAEGMLRDLDQAQLLQLCLLLKDAVIISALDECVQTGVILVPRGEIRRPRINANSRFGSWGAQVELGSRGVRVATASPNVPILRLQRVVGDLYDGELKEATEELSWLLREIDGPTVEARLAEFLRTTTPGAVINRLVTMRKEKVLRAAALLRFKLPEVAGDGEVVEHILWRLALTADEPADPHDGYWRQHSALEQRLTTAAISPVLDEEAIRSLAANYFVALEGVLDDALHFATWVLTHDHFGSEQPFVYRPGVARQHSSLYLNNLAKSITEHQPDYSEERTSLYSLCLGFKVLASHLQELEGKDDAYRRPPSERPDRFDHTTLQAFPFGHLIPYLDLQDEARDRIRGVLIRAGKVLLDSRISDIRNQQLHFRRSRADSDRFIECLHAAREAVHALEISGLARLEFGFDGREVDQWGRASVRLRDRRGKEVTFARPSRFSNCGLPALQGRQYLVTTATFAEPNEILRFRLQGESLFASLYDNFPRRPKRRDRPVGNALDGSE